MVQKTVKLKMIIHLFLSVPSWVGSHITETLCMVHDVIDGKKYVHTALLTFCPKMAGNDLWDTCNKFMAYII